MNDLPFFELIKNLPKNPGVYRMLDEKKTVLYVGKAKNIEKRVKQYARIDALPSRLKRMVSATRFLELITTKTELEALLLEAHLIKTLRPKYNILLTDDKSFPFISIESNHDYPKLYKKRNNTPTKDELFGPFATVDAVNTTVLTIQKLFQLRNCSDAYFKARKRPCLQYHLKRCSAPCMGLISIEDYKNQIQLAKQFLKGSGEDIEMSLMNKMQEASNGQRYEVALMIRNQIQALRQLQQHPYRTLQGVRDTDFICIVKEGYKIGIKMLFIRNYADYGRYEYFPSQEVNDEHESIEQFLLQFYAKTPPPPVLYTNIETNFLLLSDALFKMHSEYKITLRLPKTSTEKNIMEELLVDTKKRFFEKQRSSEGVFSSLQKLTELLNLPTIPNRIEVYDNSHTQGAFAIGAFIVATPDGFDKKSYRQYNIKTVEDTRNDFGMMKEVMFRRFRETELFPDLLMIDGGKGQLSSVLEVLDELDISVPVVSIAKGEKRNAGNETLYMRDLILKLEKHDPVLFYMEQLRDEAHRFAINTHRKRRDKNMVNSDLKELPDVGSVRKKALLQHFGSVKAIKEASIEALSKVNGIGPKIAIKIYESLH